MKEASWKQQREALGLTQYEVAAAAKICRTTYCEIERGHRQLRPAEERALRRVLRSAMARKLANLQRTMQMQCESENALTA